MQVFPKSANYWSRASISVTLFAVAGLGWMIFTLQRSDFVTAAKPVHASSRCSSATSTTSAASASTAATATPRSKSPRRPASRRPRPASTATRRSGRPARTWSRSAPASVTTAAAVDPRARPAGLRLLQPQHPREEGRRLRDVPRPRRPDAADAAEASLQMEWCLDCHRDPAQYRRPRDQVIDDGLSARGGAGASSARSW